MYRSIDVGIRIGELWYPDGVWKGEDQSGSVQWTGHVNETRVLQEIQKRGDDLPIEIVASMSLLLRAQDRQRSIVATQTAAESSIIALPPPSEPAASPTTFKGIRITIPFTKKYVEASFNPDVIFEKSFWTYDRRDRCLSDVRRAIGLVAHKQTEME